jgi:hypothetical protein
MLVLGNEILGALVALSTLIYYGSMLKVNVINPHFDGSWIKYFKSFFKRKS